MGYDEKDRRSTQGRYGLTVKNDPTAHPLYFLTSENFPGGNFGQNKAEGRTMPQDPNIAFVRRLTFRKKGHAMISIAGSSVRIPIDQARRVADALHDIADAEEASSARRPSSTD